MMDHRSVVASALLILTCLVLGLLAGGMLVIGVSLVSFWKSLSPRDFQAWFASYAHLIGRLMIPLGLGGLTITVAAVVACWRDSATGRPWLLIAVVSVLGVMITYPFFFAATNEAFVRGGLSDADARALLVSSPRYAHFMAKPQSERRSESRKPTGRLAFTRDPPERTSNAM